MLTKSVGGRIKRVRGALNKTEFARGLGISPDYVRMIEADEKRPGSTLLELICVKYGVNKDWLLTGKGQEQIDTTPEPKGESGEAAEEVTIDWEVLQRKHVVPRQLAEVLKTVNIYTMDVVRDPKNTTFRTPVESILLPARLAHLGPVALKIAGDAMAPTVKDGSVVGLNYKDKQILEGKIYVIRVPDGDCVLRRIFRGPNKIILRADNPVFPEMEFGHSGFKGEGVIVGRVEWVLRGL
jgi:phage repressor protein C with HTH and peptisase S24 domain